MNKLTAAAYITGGFAGSLDEQVWPARGGCDTGAGRAGLSQHQIAGATIQLTILAAQREQFWIIDTRDIDHLAGLGFSDRQSVTTSPRKHAGKDQLRQRLFIRIAVQFKGGPLGRQSRQEQLAVSSRRDIAIVIGAWCV